MHLCWLVGVGIVLAGCIVNASDDVYGVDDWKSDEVVKFLKQEGIVVQPDALKEAGLDEGHRFLSSDEDDWTKLGLKPEERKKLLKAIKKKLGWIDLNPVDVFEWRAANRRLTDMWIIPMLNCPRAALLWARYFDSNHALDKVNDEIDEIPTMDFWLKWTFIPSYPLYQIARKFNSHSYVDELLECTYLWSTFLEGLGLLLRIVTRDFSVPRKAITSIAFSFVCSSFTFYVCWYIVPRSLENLLFYAGVYVMLPLVLVLETFSICVLAYALLVRVGIAKLPTKLPEATADKSE